MSKKNIPATSKEAKASLSPDYINAVQNKILETLSKIGQGHYEDLAFASGLAPDRVWRRLSELHRMGKIIRTGERKILSSNRMGFVWTIKTEGKEDAVQSKKRLKKTPSVQDFSKAILKQPKPSDHTINRLF